MRLWTLITALIFGLPMLAGAQSGKPTKLEDLAAYNQSDREQVLYAGAKTEGKVTWYTSLAGGSYKDLVLRYEIALTYHAANGLPV